ncbi:MAG: hypothetical protein HW409_757 [candidate division NC10 bacterium]|nr:hypothetical protein [candidate division NC10 bacterium]
MNPGMLVEGKEGVVVLDDPLLFLETLAQVFWEEKV